MRRKDRKISDANALDLLYSGEHGIMSLVDGNGLPYGVPVNYCVINEQIYFHCAMAGRKIDCLEINSAVSFCVVGATRVLPERFGTLYESVIVSGIAREVFDVEKRLALEGLVRKYSSDYLTAGLHYIDSLFERVRVFGIAVDAISGKAKR